MRLFVAYRIAPEAAAKAASLASSLRPRLPRSSWVGEAAYHLTFAFLGEQDREVVPRLSAALESAATALEPVDAVLSGGGLFPSARKARVGWIGVEPSDRIVAIAAAVRAAVASCGVAFDEKPFKAHLTLVRIRDAWRESEAEEFLRLVDAQEPVRFRLDRISLYESRLLSSGAVHTELANCMLR